MRVSFLRNSLAIILLALVTPLVFSQESMLMTRYSVGQHLRYRVVSNTLHEGSVFAGGRMETLMHIYYTLHVTAVDREGTATVTFTQDSLLYWENSELTPYEAGEQLNGLPITMWFSKRGILMDSEISGSMSAETVQYYNGLLQDFGAEPPLPGKATGVGAEWKNDLSVYFTYARSTVKPTYTVTSKYARKENFRGREAARIEYSGNLMLAKQRVGFMSGTIHHALNEGRILRVSSKTDATLYVDVRGGRSQLRISNTQTREALP